MYSNACNMKKTLQTLVFDPLSVLLKEHDWPVLSSVCFVKDYSQLLRCLLTFENSLILNNFPLYFMQTNYIVGYDHMMMASFCSSAPIMWSSLSSAKNRIDEITVNYAF